MAGIGGGELAVLIILAVVMFGPEKLPGIARKAGRIVRYLSGIANDARGQLRQELGPEWGDLTLADLNPRTFIAKNLLAPEEVAAVREAMSDTGSELAEARAAVAGIGTMPADTSAVAAQPQARRPTVVDPDAT